MNNHPFEAVVVGSGATGGIAAMTLAQSGIRTLVIEAGPQLKVEKALGSEPTNTFRRLIGLASGEQKVQAQHPGYWKSNPLLYTNEKFNPYTYPLNKPFMWTQGRQVGGRSLTWGGITLRISDHDLKAPIQDGYGSEWPISYNDLSPHYSFIEKSLLVHGNKDGLDYLPDGEFLNPLPLTESEKIFFEKVQSQLNYQCIHSRGFAHHDSADKNVWPNSSSLGSSLKNALATGKVEILPNKMVDHLIFNKDCTRASGLILVDQTNGKREKLDANLVVLCASTIQTLRILLESKEQNLSNGFIDPSGKLGQCLMDHVSTCRFFSLPNRSLKDKDTQNKEKHILSGAGSFFMPNCSNSEHSLRKNFLRGYGLWGGIERFEPPGCLKRRGDSSIGFLIGHGEVLPRSDNKVTLSHKTDRWGIKAPHIECSWGENEKKMVTHMNKTIEDSVEASGGTISPLKELVKMPFIEPFVDSAIALQTSSPPPGYYIHEVGGAPMGVNEKTSVVDSFNRLWRCPNVLVVDGACWPTSAWQSPTLTMMAITRRACLEAIKPQS
ncbi:GMC family oxidoreductase [Prochlorococcus sp. MIT 1300]|uniref:GMC family oxidoreductase n=1 Tax=Prochlorococcus sp. MIT 1300 TaxID=3096218 RepID=UPI002A74F42A|nr:GMC family oxidoreductase [Prochlorococcus sp. MIT 1300]